MGEKIRGMFSHSANANSYPRPETSQNPRRTVKELHPGDHQGLFKDSKTIPIDKHGRIIPTDYFTQNLPATEPENFRKNIEQPPQNLPTIKLDDVDIEEYFQKVYGYRNPQLYPGRHATEAKPESKNSPEGRNIPNYGLPVENLEARYIDLTTEIQEPKEKTQNTQPNLDAKLKTRKISINNLPKTPNSKFGLKAPDPEFRNITAFEKVADGLVLTDIYGRKIFIDRDKNETLIPTNQYQNRRQTPETKRIIESFRKNRNNRKPDQQPSYANPKTKPRNTIEETRTESNTNLWLGSPKIEMTDTDNNTHSPLTELEKSIYRSMDQIQKVRE